MIICKRAENDRVIEKYWSSAERVVIMSQCPDSLSPHPPGTQGRASVASQDVFIIRAGDSRTMDSGDYGDQSKEHPAAGQGSAPQLKTQ